MNSREWKVAILVCGAVEPWRGSRFLGRTGECGNIRSISAGRARSSRPSSKSQVEMLACRFLKSLDYTGIAEIEFKYDRRDRRYKLLDVNGRFWTWSGLGHLAGVDLPYLAWRQAVGQPVKAPGLFRARTGVAWMHASRDIVAAVSGNIARDSMTLGEYLASFRRELAFANFAFDDPLPAIAELPLLAWNRLTKRSDGRSRLRGTKEFTDDLAVDGGRSANLGPATEPTLAAGLGAGVEASVEFASFNPCRLKAPIRPGRVARTAPRRCRSWARFPASPDWLSGRHSSAGCAALRCAEAVDDEALEAAIPLAPR